MSEEIKKRVFAAADKLQKDLGRAPKTYEVRAEAKCDMNMASTFMKEWKEKQRPKAVEVSVDLPVELRDAHLEIAESFWKKAQKLSNDAVEKVTAAFNLEREEIKQELLDDVEGFDKFKKETEATEIALKEELAQERAQRIAAQKEVEELKTEMVVLKTRAESQSLFQEQMETMMKLISETITDRKALS